MALPGKQGIIFVRTIGVLLAILGITFLILNIVKIEPAQILALPIDRLAAVLCLSIVFYTALLVCMSNGFAQLLIVAGIERVTFEQAITVWGKANIAKYLPSNLLHFAGRQVLGATYRWPQGSIALASILEIALQVVVPGSLIIAVLAATQRLDVLHDVMWLVPLIGVAGIAIVLALVHKRLWGCLGRYLPGVLKIHMSKRWLPAIAFSVMWYSFFFLGMCLIMTGLFTLVEGSSGDRDILTLNAVFLISWIIGFVVPGAPGGIGVREGAFAVLGGVFFPVESLVVIALLMRLITLASEGLLFFVAAWLNRSSLAHALATPSEASLPAHERQHH